METLPPADERPVASAAPPRRAASAAPALRARFNRLLAIAILLPALVYGSLQLGLDYRANLAHQDEQLRLATRLTATSVDQFMQGHASAVAFAADEASTDGGLPRLEALRARYPALITALATNAEGRILAAEPAARTPGATLQNVADRDYFAVPADTLQPYVSNAFIGRAVGSEPLVAVSAPIVRDGRFDGVVEGSIRIDGFTWLRTSILRSHGQDILIVDRSGRVIHSSGNLPFRFRQSVGGAPFLEGEEQLDGVSPVIEARLGDGRRVRAAWSELRSGWRVALFMPHRAAADVLWRQAASIAITLLLAVAGAMVVVHWQVDRLARATGVVLDALRAVAARERSPGAGLERVPRELQPVAQEVARLATQFEQAAAGLQGALDRERALAQRLHETVERQEELIATRTAELESANIELERMSRADPLTGVLNVRGFRASCDALVDPVDALRMPVGVISFDVDHFKAFNDRYGHPAGDRVLRRIASAAQAALRDPADHLARIGGEEFVVLLPEATLASSMAVAERIQAAVRDLRIPHEGAPAGFVTVSLGVVAASANELLEAILVQADEALYRAKHAGRDRIAL